MRPGELYFLLVPSPAGVGTFIAQHNWLATILVLSALALLGAFLKDIHRAGGWAAWKLENYATVEPREAARNLALRAEEDRRRIKLEGKHQRREFKRRMSSWVDQLRLFR